MKATLNNENGAVRDALRRLVSPGLLRSRVRFLKSIKTTLHNGIGAVHDALRAFGLAMPYCDLVSVF